MSNILLYKIACRVWRYVLASVAICVAATASAQHGHFDQTVLRMTVEGWHYQLRAGVNLGGMAPLPMPREIRSIESYNPLLNLYVEGRAEKLIGQTGFGVIMGFKLEQKGMKTDADVSNYYMEMTSDEGGYMEGNWTGHVSTKVRSSYVSVPIMLSYHISPRVMVAGGGYFSMKIGSDFSGTAYDGYLRNGNPTGERTEVDMAYYDFSSDMRQCHWGLQAGGEWKAYRNFSVTGEMTVGLNNIFPKGFRSVRFPLYPFYLNVGFAYNFR